MKNKTCKIIILFRRRCKSTALRGHGKRPPVGEDAGGRPKGKRVAPLALIPEDVPIDLGVIATRIETAPHCRIINAALQPLRQVLEVAALLAKVFGEIFGAIVFALVALLEIFERALIPIAEVCLVSLAAFLAQGGIFFDFIERAYAHAAFTIPLRREMLVILLAGCRC